MTTTVYARATYTVADDIRDATHYQPLGATEVYPADVYQTLHAQKPARWLIRTDCALVTVGGPYGDCVAH